MRWTPNSQLRSSTTTSVPAARSPSRANRRFDATTTSPSTYVQTSAGPVSSHTMQNGMASTARRILRSTACIASIGRPSTESTRNFIFQYTVDPAVVRSYMDLLEAYLKYFTKEWRISKPRGMGKLKVCFYHDREYFHQVSGAGPGTLAYFRFVEPIELDFFFSTGLSVRSCRSLRVSSVRRPC